MKNEKVKMEVMHFVPFLYACGGKKSRLSQLMFHLFFFCLFFAEGAGRTVELKSKNEK
jgi:hypothetical protein